MKNYPLWKSLLVFVVITLGVVFAIPSIIYEENSDNWFLNNKINLGLDLQGGSYLLLEVQLDVLYKEAKNTKYDFRKLGKQRMDSVILLYLHSNEALLRYYFYCVDYY